MPILQQIDGRSIDCPAKLNLTLAVGPPRDDGYHPIASVMVAIDCCDTLIVNPIGAGASRYVRRWADDKFDVGDADPPVQPIDWSIEQDLIFKAHKLVEHAVGRALPIECGLDKRIPAGAGLGGGSSNAAGMLVLLRELYELGLSDERLIGLGQSMGADIGFAVHALLGRPAALVTGIGEVIEPLGSLSGFYAVLVFPKGACPTGEVYRAFDADPGHARSKSDLEGLVNLWRRPGVQPEPLNDLSHAAQHVCQAIEQTERRIVGLGYEPHLTGSGSTLFVLADSREQSMQIAAEARAAGLNALATTNLPSRNGSGFGL